MTIDERLTKFVRDTKDWERMATNIGGVFLLKLPSYKTRPASVAIEINPVEASAQLLKREV
jgi:hypothetical protein